MWNAVHGENSLPLWASAIPIVVAKSNCLFNPAIYFISNTTFRHEFKEISKCCGFRCCCISINYNPNAWRRLVKLENPLILFGKESPSTFSTSKQSGNKSADDRLAQRPLPRSPFRKDGDTFDIPAAPCGKSLKPPARENVLEDARLPVTLDFEQRCDPIFVVEPRVPIASISELCEFESTYAEERSENNN